MAKTIIGEAVESGAAERAEGRVTGERLRKKAKNLDGLARLVGGFIPPEIFAGERDRVSAHGSRLWRFSGRCSRARAPAGMRCARCRPGA
jgi:hypothetical protein